MKNYRELKVLSELEGEGYEVFHKGYPDFLAYKEETNELIFVEVKRSQKRKTRKMGLSKHQRRVIQILKKFHDVKVVYID